MGAKTFGVIHQDDSFADSETSEVAVACKAAGLTLVGDEKFSVTSLNVTPQLSALQAKHPDVLVASTYGAPAGYLLQDLGKLGWNVPVLGDAAVMASAVVTSSPPSGMLGTATEANLKCLVYDSAAYSSGQSNNVSEMIAAMKKLGPVPSPLINSLGWDQVMMAAAAATQAGSATDAARIAAALEKLPSGRAKTATFPSYTFTTTSHTSNPGPSSFKFVKPTKLIDGQFGNPAAS
jgi:branched-chain amino acid transport system substrate-binding protein